MSVKEDQQTVIDLAEHQMAIQGYVRWTIVNNQMGLSRQRIAQLREMACEAGYTTPIRLKTLKASMERNLVRHEYVVTKSNRQWLLDQAEIQGISHHDLLNRAIQNYIQSHDTNDSTQ